MNKYHEDAVYWPVGAEDEFGQEGFGPPVPVKCHWEDTNQQFLDAKGNTQVSRSRIYMGGNPVREGTGEEVEITELGLLWSGKLGDLTSDQLAKPIAIPGAWRVRRLDTVKSTTGRKKMIVATL